MYHNQSRAERSDFTQYEKTGRSGISNQQRQFSGGNSTKGGGGASSASTNPSYRSFKKYNNNAPVAQPGTGTWDVDSSDPSAVRAGLNGARQQQPAQRVPEAAVRKGSSYLKPTDAPSQKTTPPVPKSPSSNVSSKDAASNVTNAGSESEVPATPGKAPGDASKSFPLQFGSISPGAMNGMQIPARTSSAPPNLDEQKKDQARFESSKTAPALPTPSVPKQNFPKKDAGTIDQPNCGEAHQVSKPKRDAQFSTSPPGIQAQKPALHPIPGMAMKLPFHQPQIPVQFGGPNPQMQSQALSGKSLPMPIPMSLPLGNPPVQHSMFVPGLQPHPMQSQGMMHQGQGLNFCPQMGPQLSHQFGSMGMSLASQFPQQTAAKYSASRKTVKITHPETHEELRLDSSPAPRLHPSVQSQSQPIPSFPPNISLNFYPNSHNATPLFYPPASSVPLSISHVPPTSQLPRLYNQGGPQRNNVDLDRWQRGAAFQRGLMPSPQTPMQMMHKAEKKYEVGKVSDEEEAKQRQLKAILNKLTPQNFEKLFQQVKEVNIDNVITLSGVISQIFDKALMEPTFCEMYANFCFHLAADLPNLSVDDEKINFKRLLLNKCQEEFERGEREEEEANKVEEEGEVKQSAEEREEKRLRARRRMLGNIRLIGELYKKRMLTERIMHECINKLLGQYQNPDEENIEALCKLMSTIGEMIDHPKAKEHMDAYYDIMAQLSNHMKLSSRVRFMLKDSIDLRKNKWQHRRKVEGPKKIEEVHRDAAQERAQGGRPGRSPSLGNSGRRGPPMDFGPRSPSMFPSQSSQIGGFRGPPQQLRGYGSQDVRTEERHLSVPLPQRLPGDDSITLGPQGGLARGMAFRGQPSSANVPLAEMQSPGDGRRVGSGQNGFSSMPERAADGQRGDLMPRYMQDRFIVSPTFDQSHPQEQNITYGNREVRNTDYASEGFLPTFPSRGGPSSIAHGVSSDKAWSEEKMREKSVAAIKEFYSARDEKEVALCIKDLNAPGFYPLMISIWVTDSFERKGMERDLLTKLLINLTEPQDAIINADWLIQGFEYVLAILEDAVNDAPRAAEFLGRIFGKIILENVISLSDIGRLIYEGGEEQGQLVEVGLAAEVLGSIFDIIKSERGESVLSEIRKSSNIRLEEFRPAGSNKAFRIDKYI